MVAQYEAEKVKYQKLMDKVPDEVSPNNILSTISCFFWQLKQKAKAEKRQKKAIASGRSAVVELKVRVWCRGVLLSLSPPPPPLP